MGGVERPARETRASSRGSLANYITALTLLYDSIQIVEKDLQIDCFT